MKCKKCGNEIEKGDKYCGICGAKIRNDEPIKIKFNYWLIGAILITVLIMIICFNIKNIKYIIIGTPEWIVTSEGEKVFDIYKEETEEKIKSELEKNMENSNINTKDFKGHWIEVYNTANIGYVGNSIHFRTEYRANLVSIEGDNSGKVKSITYLYATDSLASTIVNDVMQEFFNNIGFTYEQQNDKDFIDRYLDINSYVEKDAVTDTGKFYRTFASEAEVNNIVSAYRRYFTLPYAYDKTENGKYITIKCKN